MTIKVLVADDHDLVRTGIVRMLEDDDEICVIGEAVCGKSAVNQARKMLPDVVLLDVNMPNMNGIDATHKLKQIGDIKILAVSSLHQSPYPAMLVKAGVNGYISKGTPGNEMIFAIKKIYDGGRYFSSEIATSLVDDMGNDSPFDVLSVREKQVALMVVNCKSVQEIADALFVNTKTVNTYRYRIFEKLGVDSDVKLTHLAIRHGLISL